MCECIKKFDDNVVVTCDGIVDIPENAPINLTDGINYRLFTVVLLSIICLLLFVAVFVNPLNDNLTKWPNILKQFVGKLLTNCLSVFDHFVKHG